MRYRFEGSSYTSERRMSRGQLWDCILNWWHRISLYVAELITWWGRTLTNVSEIVTKKRIDETMKQETIRIIEKKKTPSSNKWCIKTKLIRNETKLDPLSREIPVQWSKTFASILKRAAQDNSKPFWFIRPKKKSKKIYQDKKNFDFSLSSPFRSVNSIHKKGIKLKSNSEEKGVSHNSRSWPSKTSTVSESVSALHLTAR